MKSMELSEMLKHMLREAGMTQKQLAERVSITEAAVSRYVCGNREPRFTRFSKIIDALGYKIVYVKKRPGADAEGEA